MVSEALCFRPVRPSVREFVRACAVHCPTGLSTYLRVVHGSILCDQTQPNPSADWPNPTQSNLLQVKKMDPTRPNPTEY